MGGKGKFSKKLHVLPTKSPCKINLPTKMKRGKGEGGRARGHFLISSIFTHTSSITISNPVQTCPEYRDIRK